MMNIQSAAREHLARMGSCMLIAITAATAFPAEAGTVREAIEDTLTKFEAAFNKRDAAAVASLYTEDAALLPPGEERVDGQDAIRAYWQGAIDAGLRGVSLNAVEIQSEGNLAYEVGEFSLQAPGENGELVPVNGRYIVVWQRNAGQWRLHRDIWNMAPTPPTASE